ncbi:salicylate hydroxylase [Cadophora sp. MPI-SDFR-AT-0126]|nr:salicylate hydroxylase [Leotiomycetes sp. MPI-SDFR-AT-0126]
MTFKVAIVGAGPAGLVCARLLKIADIDIEISVFERDPSAEVRVFRGGSLDLHGDSGLLAIKNAGLFETFKKWLRWDGEEIFVSDKHGTIIFHMKDPPKSDLADYERPEIDREMLKELLLDSIGKEAVQWGKALESVDTDKRTLSFRDGSTAGPFDLTIGADGAFSKLRHVMTDVKPRYSGVCGFECTVASPDEKHPNLIKRVGGGSLFAYGDHKSITAQRVHDRSLKLDIFFRTEDENFTNDMFTTYQWSQEKLKAKMLESFQDWVPEMQEFITSCNVQRPSKLWELPVGNSWRHKSGYTLIGDAANLMTPFSGEGANKALTDGWKLSEAIIEALKNKGDVDHAIANFEETMFQRAKKVQARTMLNKNRIFDNWGASSWPVTISGFVLEDMGYNLNKGWLSLLPIAGVMLLYFRIIELLGGVRRRTKDALFGR